MPLKIMQSHRRNSGSYFAKQPSLPAHLYQKSINTKKKTSVATQTDICPNIDLFCDFNVESIDEIEGNYLRALKFLNSCHEFINSIFQMDGKRFAESNVVKSFDFKVPEVPNYFQYLDMFLEQTKIKNQSIIDQRCKIEIQENDQMRSMIGDGPAMMQNKEIFQTVKSLSSEGDLIWADEQEKSDIQRSESQTSSEKSRPNLKLFSNTFEEILKTCKELDPNSIEYLLKNDAPLDEPSVHSSVQSGISQCPKSLSELRNDQHEFGLDFVDNLPKMFLSFQDLGINRKSSVLNQYSQSHSPQRVNEMFKKISRESLRTVNSSEDEYSKRTDGDLHGNNILGNCESSSDSIILTDEEFQRRKSQGWNKELRTKKGQIKDNMARTTKPGQALLKSNPLRLNEKDKSLADEKVLRTIGLFTEKGDIRPGVISILEEKQRRNTVQNGTKNVKFRTERKMDLEVRFNKKLTLSDNTSEECLSEMSQMNVTSKSLRSSMISVSTGSTISDSDILNDAPEIKRR